MRGKVVVDGVQARETAGQGIDHGAVLGAEEAALFRIGHKGVFTPHAVHDPGGGGHAFKTQGQGHGKEVDIVKIIGVATVVIAAEVVIDGAGPQHGEAHVVVELIAGGDAGRVGVGNGAAAGHVGQSQALDAHADLQIGIGHDPVEVGALHFHHGAVGAHGRALATIAPVLIADFKVDGAGKGFGGYGVNLGAQTLPGKDDVLGIGMMAVVLVDEAAVAGGYAEQPLAGSFEVDGGSAGRRAKHHSGSQGERHDTFHGNKVLPWEL